MKREGRRAIIVAALISACLIPAWILPHGERSLSASGFFMQFFVQGAWGVVPAHLNELSPAEARGTFPGTVYQLGNFNASSNAVLQARIAESHHNNYSLALSGVAICAAVAVILLAWLGREARDIDMAKTG